MDLFMGENPTAILREKTQSGRTHRELTRDGKAHLVRFCREHADLANLQELVAVLHALRHYLVLPPLQ
jgi:hypothetical protein